MPRPVPPAASIQRSVRPVDLDLDAHPLGSWLLKLGFDLVIGAVYRREVVAAHGFRLLSGSLIASNHQRDVDGPMLGTVLSRRRGLRFRGVQPFFATREDLFQPGILARLTVHWPWPFPALLRRISLGWFFPLGRTEPIRRVREFTLADSLRALVEAGCADLDAAALLNARGCRETATTTGGVSVGALLERHAAVLDNWWGLRRLGRQARALIAPGFRATVDGQLAHFAHRIDRGCCVYFAPEGSISTDGRFGRIRAGFFRIACATRNPAWIQPIALGYDTLAPGKSRVVIRIGQAFRADVHTSRRDFDANLHHAVAALASVTPSHLLARFLLHGPTRFTTRELCTWLHHAHATLAGRGVALDPLFERASADRIISHRLRWLGRKHLITREADGWYNTCPRDALPGWRHTANVVRYLDNTLADLVPDIAYLAPC